MLLFVTDLKDTQMDMMRGLRVRHGRNSETERKKAETDVNRERVTAEWH